MVDLPNRIVLVPVDDDPLQAVRESVGPAFERKDIDELREDARAAIAEETRRETTGESDT